LQFRAYKFSLPKICQKLFWAAVLLFFVNSLRAERLPLKSYTVADGLASNYVTQIYQDRKGFLWFATWEGLSVFDGYNFKNFSENEGLPHPYINQISADRKGNLWFATGGGIARLNNDKFLQQSIQPKFSSFKIKADGEPVSMAANQVNSILFPADGSIWCIANHGVYRAENADADELKFEAVAENIPSVSRGFLDGNGSVWFGNGTELTEIRGSETIKHGAVEGKHPENFIKEINRDEKGRLLFTDLQHLFELLPSDENRPQNEFRVLYKTDKPFYINDFYLDGGRIWIGTSGGVVKIENGKKTGYTSADGFAVSNITGFTRDGEGNLWARLYGGGVARLLTESITNYIPKFESKVVGEVFENSRGEILGSLSDGSAGLIDEGNLIIKKAYSEPLISADSIWFYRNKDNWTIATQNGSLYSKSPQLQLKNGRIIKPESYLSDGEKQIRFLEDEQGNLWFGKDDKNLYCVKFGENGEAETEKFPVEFPVGNYNSRIISDGKGGIWLTSWTLFGRLKDGKFTTFKVQDGLPELNIRSVFLDSRGWLWLGNRFKGISVTKNPSAENFVFTNYSKGEFPLSSGSVRSIAEDREGRMYFGTDGGLDRLTPATGEWAKFSTKTGLSGNAIYRVLKDKSGKMWVATEGGLSHIDQNSEKKSNEFPPIYLSKINVAGKDLALPETGLAEVTGVEFEAENNNLTVGFVAPNFSDEDLRYQYLLEGTDSDWSKPSKERSVSFSLLPPNKYRFQVRTVNQNGVISPQTARFEFRILPPIWRRWWFVLGVISLIGLAIYQLYRFRVSRLLEIERTRTRIATDLHDDIGTNLSKISLLSEIVKMQLQDENEERRRMLEVIGETSRESVAAMSDIVWAINPKKDSLADMTRRMRQHAEEVFLEKGVNVKFNTPETVREIKLPMEIRRELYLIFKEAVTNAAKHSDCKNVEIDFQTRHNGLFLSVKDDGKGFDANQNGSGNGLNNLKLRAEKINAKLEIESEIGKGTTVNLTTVG
jgi:ligand-binding sensor domain-containing protein/two-component sensor histidine kinase